MSCAFSIDRRGDRSSLLALGTYAPNVLDSRVFMTIVLLLIPVAISGGIHLDGLLIPRMP